MIKKLLIPLDGSHLAETVLPLASLLAEKLGASVTLLHLIERHPPSTIHGDRHLASTEEAEAYLKTLAASAFPASVPVDWHVHTVEVTNVPSAIVEHSEEMDIGLVMLCTHGETGLRDYLVGSIAQQVISMGSTPVLLMPPTADDTAQFLCRRLLVPLDGKREHELSLPAAVEIARACDATIHLEIIVPTLETLSGEDASTGRLLPSAMSEALNQSEQEAGEYLAALAQTSAGVPTTTSVVRGDPVACILSTAEAQGDDLVVLATHGHKGPGAFWSGSVAPKVILRTKTPLLLVRAPTVEG